MDAMTTADALGAHAVHAHTQHADGMQLEARALFC